MHQLFFRKPILFDYNFRKYTKFCGLNFIFIRKIKDSVRLCALCGELTIYGRFFLKK